MHHIVDFADDYNEIPDPSHVEKVMTGFIDTVTGSEGMNLTAAQRYVHGVMYAAGLESGLDEITGNEEGGLFGTIGKGISKMWEYIQKMFKSLWEFLFGKPAAEKDAKIKATVAEAEVAVKAMEAPKVTPANVVSAVKAVEAKVEKLPAGPEKTKLEKKVEEVKEDLKIGKSSSKSEPAKSGSDDKSKSADSKPAGEAGKPTPAEVAKAVPQVIQLVKEVFELSVLNATAIKRNCESLDKALATIKTRKESFVESAEDKSFSERARKIYTEMSVRTGAVIEALEGFVNGTHPDYFKSVSAAKSWIADSKRALDQTEGSKKKIQEIHTDVKSKMAKLKDEITKNQDEKKHDELSDDLFDLSCSLNATSGILTFLNITNSAVGNIAYALRDECPELKEAA
jgi:hypothetical protein